MNAPLKYHPITLADRTLFLERTTTGSGQNCDLNFMNIFSWQTLYQTEVAQWEKHLVCRFKVREHTAFMGIFDPNGLTELLDLLLDEAVRNGHPFLLMGICEDLIPYIENAKPGYFLFECNRDYCDYIYLRKSLASLTGKKLQSKRNFVNRFRKSYPDYTYQDLRKEHFPACLALAKQWMQTGSPTNRQETEAEQHSMKRVFENWDNLGATGGTLFVGENLVAFTYGAPINSTIFDVCAEKANPDYKGSYATINKEFVTHLPEQFTLINREEDLGITGLRKAKLSYHPETILKKYAVMAKHHFQHGYIK